MPFKTRLNQLLDDVPGALGAIIVDWEGEAVDQVSSLGDYDIRLIGAHNGIILSRMQETFEHVDAGELEEVVIRTTLSRTMIRPLTEDYLILLELDQRAQISRARHCLDSCVEELRHEFDV